MRVCGEGIALSASCSEMQPTQRALHFGATGNRRLAAFEKDVLRGETAVFARAQTLSCASVRLRGSSRDAALDDRLEFARREAARLPIFAFIGLHRRHCELVVDDAANV